MSNVDTIFSVGDNAASSQFEVFFPEGIPGGGNSQNVELRSDQPIDIPEIVYGQFEFFFKGVKITLPSRLEETDKNITISIRLDQQFNTWDDLRAWQLLGFNEKDGTAAPNITAATTVGFRILDGNNNPAKTFYLKYTFLRGLKITSLDPASNEPIRAELNLMFNDIDDGNGI
jgi:hypothetical protein